MFHQLAHAVMDRALNGVEAPRYYRGEMVGMHREYDNRLAMWLLDNPWKVGRQQVAREYVAEGESPSRAAARAAKKTGQKRGEVYDRLVGS